MNDEKLNGPYRLRAIERRLEMIEATKPDVMASQIEGLSEEVRGLRRALYTFGFSVVAGAIVFSFSVFELLQA